MPRAINHKLDRSINTRSKDLIFEIHEYDIDIKSNHIYLFGIEDERNEQSEDVIEAGIEYRIANRLIRNINLCMRVNPKKPILIHMKTCGGDPHEGLAIYDTIKLCPSPITILSYTHSRSMSSVILQAADKRVLMPSSYVMLHDGTLGYNGTKKQVESYIDHGKKYDRYIEDILVRSMQEGKDFKGKSLSQIKRWLKDKTNKKEDLYISTNKAIDMGLADWVFDGDWSKLLKY